MLCLLRLTRWLRLTSRVHSSSSRSLNSPAHAQAAARHLMSSSLHSSSATECRSPMLQVVLRSGAVLHLLCLIQQTTEALVLHGATHSSRITLSTVSVCISVTSSSDQELRCLSRRHSLTLLPTISRLQHRLGSTDSILPRTHVRSQRSSLKHSRLTVLILLRRHSTMRTSS